ncbi:MAG: CDP-alcohol phosphatidyltransferase family protein [Flavobacteriaceae bacterium]|nr:CDP-alcohol phosphatidyltransferase family protein [Flavobacteriaceae bacterium]
MTNTVHQNRIELWSICNAFALVIGLIFTLISEELNILLAVFSISIAIFIILNIEYITKLKFHFGVANAITLLRYLIIVLSFLCINFSNTTLLFYSLSSAVILDYFDGKAARYFKENSLFGQYFDMEIDAFYTLLMCCFYSIIQEISFWIIIPGVLRYAFRLCTFCFPKPHVKEEKKTYATVIAASYFVVLLLGLITHGIIQQLILILGSLAIVISFSIGFFQYYKN